MISKKGGRSTNTNDGGRKRKKYMVRGRGKRSGVRRETRRISAVWTKLHIHARISVNFCKEYSYLINVYNTSNRNCIYMRGSKNNTSVITNNFQIARGAKE